MNAFAAQITRYVRQNPSEASMNINDKVENFTLQNQDGAPVSLTDFADKPVVLFFYPRANTSGCTIEACGFRDAFRKLHQAGVAVLGVSRDDVKAQKNFQRKYNLPYDLLADPDMTLIKRYGLLKPKNMYGKLVKGVERTTYIISPDTGSGQRLLHVFHKVKPENHVEEVMTLLQNVPAHS